METPGRNKLGLLVITICVIAAVCWKLYPAINRRAVRSRDDKTRTVIQQLASDVEELRLKTGIVPPDEEHLVKLLGKPLPRSGWNTLVKYVVTNGNFRIETVSPYPHWMIFEYDSRNPTTGVASYSF